MSLAFSCNTSADAVLGLAVTALLGVIYLLVDLILRGAKVYSCSDNTLANLDLTVPVILILAIAAASGCLAYGLTGHVPRGSLSSLPSLNIYKIADVNQEITGMNENINDEPNEEVALTTSLQNLEQDGEISTTVEDPEQINTSSNSFLIDRLFKRDDIIDNYKKRNASENLTNRKTEINPKHQRLDYNDVNQQILRSGYERSGRDYDAMLKSAAAFGFLGTMALALSIILKAWL